MLRVGVVGCVLIVAGLAALRTPAVQTQLVRWAATGEGWRLDVARVSVGLAGGEARGLVFAMPGIEARAEPGVALRVSPGKFLFGGRELRIERAAAVGIRIVVTPAELEPSQTPFGGMLAMLKSPLPWALGETEMDAEIEVREAGTAVATARLWVAGGNVAAARPGEFSYDLELVSRLVPPGPDARVRSKGVVRVTQDAAHGVAEIELRGDLRLPAYGRVKAPAGEFVLRIEQTAVGERYRGRVGWGDAAEARFEAEYDHAGRRIHGVTTGAVGSATAAWAGLDSAAWPQGRGVWTSTFEHGVDDASFAARLVVGLATRPELLIVETKDLEAAEVELRALPLAWLGRWTDPLGLRFGSEGAADGKWRVARVGAAGVGIETLRPLALGPVRYEDGRAPALTAARIEVDIAAKATTELAELELRALRVIAENTERSEARVEASGWWDRAKGDGELTAVRVEWRERAEVMEPTATFTLGGALKLDTEGKPTWVEGAELGRFSVKDFSLAGLSRWAGGKELVGRWARGSGAVKASDAAGGLSFQAEERWSFEAVRVANVAEGAGSVGTALFAGEVALLPEVKRSGAGVWSARAAELRVADTAGRVIAGELAGTWNEMDGAYSGQLDLRAELPAGAAGPQVIGPLVVELRVKAGTAAPKVGQIEDLALSVSRIGGEGELVSVRSEGGLLYVRRPSGEVMLNSLGPWRLKTAELPLAWAREYLPPGLELHGDLQPFECLLLAELGKYKLRATRRVEVQNLSVKRDGAELLRGARLAFYPGLDWQVMHTFKPEFQLAWGAQGYATEGVLESRAGRAVEWELATGFVGDFEHALPKTIDLVARGDFSALRGLAPAIAAQLPPAGKFTMRIDGDMLEAEPMEVWARIEGVPAAKQGGRALAPLEMAARGKVDGRARVARFDVALKMGEGETAGDLAFEARLAPAEGTLRIDSALRGKRWDLTESLAWASAWSGVPAEETVAAVLNETESAAAVTTPLGSAVWGPLRGVFELEIGELLLAPYRVTTLRGRIEAEEHSLAVSGLGGEMFAGRLGGDFTLRYEPGAEGGDHALAGAFMIEQFDTARVVQEVFPNEYGLLDARVNLRAGVRGRAYRLWDLLERAEATFAVDGKGVVRLTHPDARTAATLLVMGGVVTLSPELRALGRLLRKFAEMPVDELRVDGSRDADGSLRLSRVRFDSPQARLEGVGEVAAVEGMPLPTRPLSLRLGLSAKDETGVILGRMRLLEKKADAEGFRSLTQPVEVRGEAARPDASEFYDLLARGAAGSRGTWGLIMRKVQREVEKEQAKAAKEAVRAEEAKEKS